MVDLQGLWLEVGGFPLGKQRGDFLACPQRIQLRQSTVEAYHGHQRAAIAAQQGPVHPDAGPAGIGVRLQREHTQGGKVGVAADQGLGMGGQPLALPDVELLVEGRRYLFTATGG